MKFLSIEELMLELSFDGIRKDENTIEFHSPDNITTTILSLNTDFFTITLKTKIYHSFNQIEGTIFTLSNELYNEFSEDTVTDIIEDIATRIKYLLFPKIYNSLEVFELKESLNHESTLFHKIDYKDKDYETLKQEIYQAIDYSFKLILNLQEKIGIFIEKNVKDFLNNPEIEIIVLKIKNKLFRVQFYSSMTGRFASEQKRKAKKVYKEAIDLYEKFKKEFPEEAKKREEIMNFLFDKYKI